MYGTTEQRLASFLFLDTLALPPETFTVVRLQAPGILALSRDKGLFDGPFDPRLGKPLVKTATLLLQERTDLLFAFVGRAEISLLLELTTHRDRRSPWALVAATASLASARLSLQLGEPVAFEPGIYLLPGGELVEEYFAWQQETTRRAALAEHCQQALLAKGVDRDAAHRNVQGATSEELIAALTEHRVDVAQLPAWQKDGSGIYRRRDPAGGLPTLLVDPELPTGEGLRPLLRQFL